VIAAKGRYQQHPERPELSYKCVIAEASDERRGKKKPGRERLYVVRRNTKEEAHAKHRIQTHLEKVEGILATGSAKAKEALLHHRTYKRYVKPNGRFKAEERPEGAVVLDRAHLATLRLRAGKSVIGCDRTDADPVALDDVYRNLFDVERIFRQLKSTIEVGPIRHRRADRILAHCMLAVMARNLAAWLELRSGMTFEALRKLFENVNVQQVEFGVETYWQCVELEPAQKKAIRKIGYTLPPVRFQVATDPRASILS
jgi:transposase